MRDNMTGGLSCDFERVWGQGQIRANRLHGEAVGWRAQGPCGVLD